jgi:hypothetical protein
MDTVFMLTARYDGRPIISVEDVRKDFFTHLSADKFSRKLAAREIDLLVVPMEKSQKSAKGVYLKDLASYIDKQREMALLDYRALRS